MLLSLVAMYRAPMDAAQAVPEVEQEHYRKGHCCMSCIARAQLGK